MRIEQEQPSRKNSHTFVRGAAKAVWFLVRLPFKISLRVFALVALVFVVIIIAETGIWTIPVVSPLLYRQPQPTRYVQSSPFSAALLDMSVQNATAMATGAQTITISEGQLTALVQEANRVRGNPTFSTVQTVITPKEIELFGNISSRPSVFVTMHLLPKVSQGHTSLEVQKIWIGHVALPKQLVHTSLVSYVTDILSTRMFGTVTVQAISLEDRSVRVKGVPSIL